MVTHGENSTNKLYSDDEEVDELTEEYQEAGYTEPVVKEESVKEEITSDKVMLDDETKLSQHLSRPRNSIEAAMLLVNFNKSTPTNHGQEKKESNTQCSHDKVQELEPKRVYYTPVPITPRPMIYPHPPFVVPYYYMVPQYHSPYPKLPLPPLNGFINFEPPVKKRSIKREDVPMSNDPEVKARKQKLRFSGDQYTPQWVRFNGQLKEGLCETCNPGKWLQLKNSAYWYHKQFLHGISSVSGKVFSQPLETRWQDHDMIEGLCHQCREWVSVSNVRRKNSVLWYRHAHKCHVYSKPKLKTKQA